MKCAADRHGAAASGESVGRLPLGEAPGGLAVGDRTVIAVAAAMWAGAVLGGSVGGWSWGGPGSAAGSVPETGLDPQLLAVVGVGLFGVALRRRRAPGLVLAAVLVGMGVSVRAHQEYRLVDAGALDGSVVVVGDPQPVDFGVRVEVRLDDGRRVEATAPFDLAGPVGQWQVGQRWHAVGTLRPYDAGALEWARPRHLAGRLSLRQVSFEAPGAWWWAPSAWLRTLVARSSQPLGDHAALYTGLVIGDDREQELAQQARFRYAGMSHLLAVSGQNVAFVLLVCGPLVERMSRRWRVLATMVVLLVFVAATRFEPSVLRATATAGIAVFGRNTGRTSTSLGHLGLAVIGLVVIDPFLVDVVGFQLSVAASAGILVLGPSIAERVPGPRPWAEAVAVTTAAQLGVSPLLIVYFGPVSAAALPANLAVGWAAGAVMVWGMSVGLLVGLGAAAAPGVAAVVQQPAQWLLIWIDLVARWAASLPAPRFGASALVVLLATTVGRWARRSRERGPARAATRPTVRATVRTTLSLALLVLALRWPRPPANPVVVEGARYYPSGPGTSAVLILPTRPARTLPEALLDARITDVGIVVATRGGVADRSGVVAAADVAGADIVLAPPQHRIRGVERLTVPTELRVWTGETRDRVTIRPEEAVLLIE